MKDEENVEEYLKKRLLIDDNQNINTKFDELISQVKMLVKEKCREQRLNCAMGLELWFEENSAVVRGVKMESIVDAKEPKI
jgi:hypothetical protein